MKDMNQELEGINELIDNQEIAAFEAALDEFIDKNEFPYEIEESKVFAKRIIKKKAEGRYKMRKSLAAACIIGVCLVGGTAAYAGGLYLKFTFATSHGTAIVKTTEDLTEDQAKQMVDNLINLPEAEHNEQFVGETEIIDEYYATVEEAEKKLGFPLIVPENKPEQFKKEKKVFVDKDDAGKTYVYVQFEPDTDEEYSFLRIDVIYQEYSKGTYIEIINDIDAETYITPDDTKYIITREKDEVAKTMCLTAKTYIGQYEYSIFTNGIEETAFYNMIDSVNLSRYKLTED